MKNVTAILSMLHEPEAPNSATRQFRAEPVLSWTLRRLCRAQRLGNIAVLCWEDQVPHVEEIAEEYHAYVLAKGPRHPVPQIESVAAARRWSDGWRGGLLSTCHFDLGFHGGWFKELSDRMGADGIVLVEPSSGLIDPILVDRVIDHAATASDLELCFAPAASGLCGPLLRASLLEKLAPGNIHPGRLLHYMPEHPARDPLGTEACVPIATSVARSTHNFRLDSDRQVARIGRASSSLNGTLAVTDAEELVGRMHRGAEIDLLPREIVIELNTTRQTSPSFWPGTHRAIDRASIPLDQWARLFSEAASAADDLRLTIGGVGDPLESPQLFDVIDAARTAGISAIHVQTDLLAAPERIDRLAAAEIDLVSVNLPAMSMETYTAVMGVDRFRDALQNIARFVEVRQALGRGVPLLVPVLVKCQRNLGEMEAWYDQWLRALGSAVIEGPSDFAGQIPALSVADMSPTTRRPCARLNSRMTVLCDGSVVSCEQDVLGLHPIARIGEAPLSQLWGERFASLRADHASGCFDRSPLCAGCKEWHRAA